MEIKQFLRRLMLFSIIAMPMVMVECLYSYFTRGYELTVYGSEVYFSIKKSKVSKKVKILIIGDSLGKQLYDNNTYNDAVYSLTCNQGISMAGHYILLQNFISRNRNKLPAEVVFIISPGSFRNNLDQVFSYNYFLKPFYKAENEKYFTQTCFKQIKKIPLYYTAQFPIILSSNWSPDFDTKDAASYQFISPVSNEYLVKIKALCLLNHISFSLHCPPVTMAYKKRVLQLSASINEFEKCGLRKEFTAYFKSIKFLPDSVFQDHIHFKKQYIPVDYFKLNQNDITN